MKRRYYSHKKRECSVCGLLCTPESFKYHNALECYAMEQQNKELEKEIKGGNDGQPNNWQI